MNIEALSAQMLILFALIFIGYIAMKIHFLPNNANKVIADLVVNITCPATTLYAVATSSHAMSNKTVFGILGITALTFAGLILLATLFTKVLGLKGPQGGVYRFMLVFSNCGFLGFPVVQALFGGDAVFIASIYNLIFQLLCFTYGVNQVAANSGTRNFSPKMLYTPMVITSVLALIFYLADVPFHSTVVDVLETLDQITGPASMLVIGCALAAYPLKQIFGRWQVYVFCVLRLVGIPLLVWGILRLFITDQLILGVMVVLSALPAATNTALLCAKYGGDESTAASGLFVSTLLSMVTLPLLLRILF